MRRTKHHCRKHHAASRRPASPRSELLLQIAAKHKLFRNTDQHAKQEPARNLLAIRGASCTTARAAWSSGKRGNVVFPLGPAGIGMGRCVMAASMLIHIRATLRGPSTNPSRTRSRCPHPPRSNQNRQTPSQRAIADRNSPQPHAEGNPAHQHQFKHRRHAIGPQPIHRSHALLRPDAGMRPRRDTARIATISTTVCHTGAIDVGAMEAVSAIGAPNLCASVPACSLGSLMGSIDKDVRRESSLSTKKKRPKLSTRSRSDASPARLVSL